MTRALSLLLSCLLLAIPAAARAATGQVSVYRCTGAHGQVTLRDTPCRKGETQQERTMLRPKDPPKPAITAPVSVRGGPVLRETVTRVVQAPRTLYRCITPDGANYTSESPEGNLRWVPLWTLGYPVVQRNVPVLIRGDAMRGRYQDRHTDVRIGGGTRMVIGDVPTAAGYGAGTWVRDSCSPLPQDEACDMLSSRRAELRRRNVALQATERAQLDAEEAVLDARLRNDCGL